MGNDEKNKSRRDFIKTVLGVTGGGMLVWLIGERSSKAADNVTTAVRREEGYRWEMHEYAYLIDTRKCIGCGFCVLACKRENDVPDGYFRTWVERYIVPEFEPAAQRGVVNVDSPDGGLYGFEPHGIVNAGKGFFVPKMCNHCRATPCTQVCPVGASYATKEGVVLVDQQQCIGCAYCVQACPYGSRFIHPVTHTASKCTWCYHRITKGLKPACVEACPVGARRFGDLRDVYDPVRKILSTERISVLQPELLTKPQCYYLGMDKEVK